MSSNMSKGNKGGQNSLLSASNFFMDEEFSSLLVPVSLSNDDEATDEIDLQSDDDLKLVPVNSNANESVSKNEPNPSPLDVHKIETQLLPPLPSPPPIPSSGMITPSFTPSFSHVDGNEQESFGGSGVSLIQQEQEPLQSQPQPMDEKEQVQVSDQQDLTSTFQNITLDEASEPFNSEAKNLQPKPISPLYENEDSNSNSSVSTSTESFVKQNQNEMIQLYTPVMTQEIQPQPIQNTSMSMSMPTLANINVVDYMPTSTSTYSISTNSSFRIGNDNSGFTPPVNNNLIFTPIPNSEIESRNDDLKPVMPTMQPPPISAYVPQTISGGGQQQFAPSPPPLIYQPQPQQSYYPTPTDIYSAQTSPHNSPLPPPPAKSIPQGSQQNYRLGSQKLVYAKYPGIQTTQQQQPNYHSQQLPPPSSTFQPSAPPIFQPSSSSSQPPPPNILNMGTINSSPQIQSPSHMNIKKPLDDLSSGVRQGFHVDEGPTYTFGAPHVTRPIATSLAPQQEFKPISYHWFYSKEFDGKTFWKSFSLKDSEKLEQALAENRINEPISTDGGRYDVTIFDRLKKSVYWEEELPSEVKRCSWYYKEPTDSKFVPYDEEFSKKLEEAYVTSYETGIWQRRLDFNGGEAILFHSENVIVHFCQAASPDEWGQLPESQLRPRVVKRGIEGIGDIEEGEQDQIDHLILTVHGIGSVCDFKCRDIVEAVDDFRQLSIQLANSHFKTSFEAGTAGRIEFLPLSWHKALHSEGGIDQKLEKITLKSIPKLRNFTNDTLLDILFYTSPIFCQRIVDTVAGEMNRLYNLFKSRNTQFKGPVSLCGHSLGSLIIFDILSNQPIPKSQNNADSDSNDNKIINSEESRNLLDDQTVEKEKFAPILTTTTTGINYPVLDFNPTAFFALGMFLTVRGKDEIGKDFHFPTCSAFFNIFHPYDPVSYRIEMLIDSTFDLSPQLIPHHKGRRRMHLEIKDAFAKYGFDFKNKLVESIRSTVTNFSRYINAQVEQPNYQQAQNTYPIQQNENESAVVMGKLNSGRRVDYVLQEAPLESFNEYLFALTSHVCYWESEDTLLLIIKEIYSQMGIFEDSKTPAGSSNELHSKQDQFDNSKEYPYNAVTTANNFNRMPENNLNFHSTQMAPIPPQVSNNLNNISASQFSSPPTMTPPNPNPNPPLMMSMPSVSTQPLNIPLINMNVPETQNPTMWSQPPPPPQESFTPTPFFHNSNSVVANNSNYQQQSPLIIGGRPIISPTLSTIGLDPTAPPTTTTNKIGPPPRSGFVIKK